MEYTAPYVAANQAKATHQFSSVNDQMAACHTSTLVLRGALIVITILLIIASAQVTTGFKPVGITIAVMTLVYLATTFIPKHKKANEREEIFRKTLG
jgi:hypothetical protein